MTKTEDKIYEYACHEGNYGMAGMLKGARVDEKGAGSGVSKSQRCADRRHRFAFAR